MPDVLLCDDHALFAEALAVILDRHGLTVGGVVTSVAAVAPAVRALRPRTCVIDRHFADGDGLELIRPVVAAHPGVRVLMLTADREEGTAARAMELGASGYLCKTAGVASLVSAITRITGGETVVDVPAPVPVRRAPESVEARRLADYLTPRERECLELLVDGLGSRAIADHLGVSTTTVRTYVQAVLTKLGVHSRLEAASFAVRHSLLDHPA